MRSLSAVSFWLLASVAAAVPAPAPVADIHPGPASSHPSNAVDLDGTILFAAADTRGAELWRSDGTEAGTKLIKDVVAGPEGSKPRQLTKAGRIIFFVAGRGTTRELWKTDGTAAGTVRVRAAGSAVDELAAIGGIVFFQACTTTQGCELWRTDGTETGTFAVRDVRPGPVSSNPRGLTAVGRTLFFSANDGRDGIELWKSDGTPRGTVLVRDIDPRPATRPTGPGHASPENLVASGGRLYFSASTAARGRELWVTDGTPTGTALVKDLSAGATDTQFKAVADLGGRLFVSAIVTDATAPRPVRAAGLWRTEGTAARTVEVRGAAGETLDASLLTAVDGALFFAAQSGAQLWTVGRDDAQATLLATTGTRGAIASLLGANGRLFFSAEEAASGRELWSSDGTAAGTALIGDINPGAASSNARPLMASGLTLFLSADGGDTGAELWKIAAHGTGPVADAGPDRTVAADKSVTLDGSRSSDPEGDTLTFEWSDANGVIGRTATVSVTPKEGEHTYTLTVSDGKQKASDSVTVTAKSAFKVTLSVASMEGGRGRVDTAAGASCAAGATCEYEVKAGESITFQADAQDGSSFGGWTGDCSGTEACTFTPDADATLGARFEAAQRLTLDVSGTEQGFGTIIVSPGPAECTSRADATESCAYDFAAGTQVTLSPVVSPDSLSAFAGWTGACTGTGPCTITMDGHQWVGASFKGPQKLIVNLSGTDSGWGHVAVNGPGMTQNCVSNAAQTSQICEYLFAPGTPVTVLPFAPPDSMSIFSGWQPPAPPSPCIGDMPACEFTMDTTQMAFATFKGPQRLIVNLSGTDQGWGIVNVNGTSLNAQCSSSASQPSAFCEYLFTPGTRVTVLPFAPPDAMSIFSGWQPPSPPSPCIGDMPACEFTMDTMQMVFATFKGPQTLSLGVLGTDEGWGTVLVNGGPVAGDCTSVPNQGRMCFFQFTPGTLVTLSPAAPPDSMSVFAGWKPDPFSPCIGDTQCNLTMDGHYWVEGQFKGPQSLAIHVGSANPAERAWGTVLVNGGAVAADCTNEPGFFNYCVYKFAPGTPVTLQPVAPPASGSVFAGWNPTPTPNPCVGTEPCTVVMTELLSLDARFRLQ